MLEAIACGLPVITTLCEGTEELINENGRIVPIAAAENFSKVITEILSDTDKYNQMAAASRKTAEQFSWANSAKQYIELYNRIK